MGCEGQTVAGEEEASVGLPASCAGTSSNVAVCHPHWTVLSGGAAVSESPGASVSKLQPMLLHVILVSSQVLCNRPEWDCFLDVLCLPQESHMTQRLASV